MLACNSSLVKDIPLEQSLPLMARAGFSHVSMDRDIRVRFLFKEDRMQELKRILDAYPVKVDWFHAPYDRIPPFWGSDAETRGIALGALTSAVRQVSMLGARNLIVHCIEPPMPDDASIEDACEYAAETYAHLVETGKSCGVGIACENLGMPKSTVINQYLLDNIPELGLCLDIGHANIYGHGDIFPDQYAARIKALHIHDNNGEYDEHNMPGSGTVDWPRVAGKLIDSGYQGVWSLETFTGTAPDDEPLQSRYDHAFAMVSEISRGESPA